jgi:antitoxin VapB
MTRAKVFQSGGSQAVRLPKAFRVTGREVEIFRRGDEIILREVVPSTLEDAFDLICEMPQDMLDDRIDPPAQEREGL